MSSITGTHITIEYNTSIDSVSKMKIIIIYTVLIVQAKNKKNP